MVHYNESQIRKPSNLPITIQKYITHQNLFIIMNQKYVTHHFSPFILVKNQYTNIIKSNILNSKEVKTIEVTKQRINSSF